MAMTDTPSNAKTPETDAPKPAAVDPAAAKPAKAPMPKEIGGPSGPEPTRFGDWERKGRVSDF